MKSAKRKQPAPANQTSFGTQCYLVKEVCEYRKPPFLFELTAPQDPMKFGILSSLAIFPYQPAKPQRLVHAKAL